MIVVMGATGLQGGAVTRHLLKDGWHVRALTRNATSKQARALAARGVEVVQGDMGEAASLRPIFAGAYGVYSVQNPFISGPEAEVRQGKTVADIAKDSGVQHLVYGSAGIGRKGSGIPSWETKLQIEDHIKALSLPLTILRPMAFMELMTEKKFFPAVATWHVMPRLMGAARPVGWLCVDDLGAIAAQAFADPQRLRIGIPLKREHLPQRNGRSGRPFIAAAAATHMASLPSTAHDGDDGHDADNRLPGRQPVGDHRHQAPLG
jgi:uncharacterized protein YbjT (DUF2867 family)